MAEAGHTVHLIDPVPRHLEQAAAYAGCTTELGDARHLTAAPGTYDAVLLLGPRALDGPRCPSRQAGPAASTAVAAPAPTRTRQPRPAAVTAPLPGRCSRDDGRPDLRTLLGPPGQ
ncbi:hypothetical protein ACH4TC_00885 [Streptomyces spororaveus]|uniref:hypothetical protein n=1 Tax=Streptomyces spororaveus TaxID=284039 RepID=UPI00378DAC50